MKRKPSGYGHFSGTVRTEWVEDDPRNMRIISDLVYTDSRNVSWKTSKNTVVNGASTGWFLRRVLPAYVGWYRRATVFHDDYCDRKECASWKVHRMFYEASICDGTCLVKAWVMWFFIRVFGPKFKGRSDA